MTERDQQFVRSVQQWRNRSETDELLDRLIRLAEDSAPKTHPKLGGFVSETTLKQIRKERSEQ